MFLSFRWLASYLPKLPAPEQLTELLLLHGIDIESVRSAAGQFEKVVVGEIVAVKPHPNADKLQLADVMIEPGGQPQEIVCGASNVAVGQKVPVALVGAKLPNGLTIEPRAIRGVTSNGMICAEDELGLGKNHAGIFVLDPKTNIGTPFAETLGEVDTVFDVTTPANRADLMSMRGLAWEIGAMLGQKPKFTVEHFSESTTPAKQSVVVRSEDAKLCSLFTARVIRSVTHKPTPTVVTERLQAAGMRSISPIVDITNYVMLEYGQPLHAYDVNAIQGQSLTARFAKTGERLVTLDGKSRQLTPEMLVIADDRGPVGLAGVMGGQGSEVSEQTTDIILEAAIFNPVAIRKTSRRLGLVSEASKRFEKGLWPEVTVAALDAAAAMIAEICGGTIEKGIVSTGPMSSPARAVTLKPAYIPERLGMKIVSSKSKTILQRLGFGVTGTAAKWTVRVPAWRPDVSLPEDIVDEVGRMTGYEQAAKKTSPDKVEPKDVPAALRFKEEVKNILVDMGFTEVISHAFYGAQRSGSDYASHFIVANPLDKTQHFLRNSLLPQMEDVLKREADAGHDAMIFELGRVFDPGLPGDIEQQQPWRLGIGIAHKGGKQLREFAELFQQKLATTKYIRPDRLSAGPSALVRGRSVDVFEWNLKELASASRGNFGPWDPNRHVKKNVRYREQSKYPAVKRDISFWWPKGQSDIETIIQDLRIPTLISIQQKDAFTKDGKTSYAYAFVYQSQDRTLTKAEVDEAEYKIKNALVAVGAVIR